LKTYEIILKPLSGFGTPLKGDTLFGHICWQAAYDSALFAAPLDTLLSGYTSSPFLVISSAYIVHRDNGKTTRVFKRPDMPLSYLFDIKGPDKKEIIKERKILKAKKWMVLSGSGRVESLKNAGYESDQDLFKRFMDISDKHLQKESRKKRITSLVSDFTQPHNTINRQTGTTGEGGFAPFTVDQQVFFANIELSVFAGISENIQIKQVEVALSRMGATGFGKDASTGLGKFSVIDASEISLAELGSDAPNACYTLSPSVPEKDSFRQIYFTPFTRFGRHGDTLAKSANPFKNPVIMADEGAVLIPERMDDFLKRPYVGTGISNISKAEPKTVMQGYSLYIPVKVEV
jgi:CRISPR-associated protein Csm4